ncbi:alpha/beta fold hydrolase [uncultured Propionibacterium sp.]|uniref:thioesterase II family protein n=1 Tax=uncultured Propionibacterium sp. TaxID=218066 RepID=UPI002930BE27|nr:alpha/beta fold hydrolase [uncultured Propionibacterium sp.]
MSAANLLCFPHAGGSSFYYERWRSLFTARNIDLHIAPYPHRDRRINEPMPKLVQELAEDLYMRLMSELGGNYVTWGHSMGAIIAYEVTKRAIERLGNPPILFTVSSSSAPCDAQFIDTKTLVTPDGIRRVLRRYGGVEEAALVNRDFMEYFTPILVDDMMMLARYEDNQPAVLSCPLLLLEGSEDTSRIAFWEIYTSATSEVRFYPGGHFFITTHAREVAATISHRLSALTPKHSPFKLKSLRVE